MAAGGDEDVPGGQQYVVGCLSFFLCLQNSPEDSFKAATFTE